jgi:hypothetical protein
MNVRIQSCGKNLFILIVWKDDKVGGINVLVVQIEGELHVSCIIIAYCVMQTAGHFIVIRDKTGNAHTTFA